MAWTFACRTFGNNTGGAAPPPPTVPTLAMADKADGTGATATISGGDVGATNTVYTQPAGGTTWTNGGSRTGNGTVNLSLAVGFYWAYVVSSNGTSQTTSNSVYFAVTSGTQSIHYRCLQAVKSALQNAITAGTISGITTNQVYDRWVPTDRQVTTWPAIFVCPVGAETTGAGTNARDDVSYPVLVGITDNNNQRFTQNLNTYTLWRQRAAELFHHARLANVSEVYTCVVEPLDVVDLQQYLANLFVSGFVVRCVARKTRQ